MAKSDLYKAAGVDIDLAHTLLDRVKKSIAATRRPEMLAPIGGFGGLFQIATLAALLGLVRCLVNVACLLALRQKRMRMRFHVA